MEEAVSPLSAVSLASVLDQSGDCFKILTLDGRIQYMNNNGLCAMEIDDFKIVEGTLWADLLPETARLKLVDSYREAAAGQIVQFRAFIPTLKNSPRWWDVTLSPVADGEGAIVGFLSISRDVTFNHQGREALKIAAAEMKHRLSNTYQTISSLMVLTARGDASHEEFAKQMADRLGALGRAQALFTDDDAPCDLDKLIPALVTPFGNDTAQVAFDPLPAIALQQSQADAIALVVGELAVNSSKHGAFRHGGAVHVTAAVDGNDVLTVVWRERCDLPVQQNAREGGQGLKLMDRIMRARDGSMVVDWEDHGIVATLALGLAASS
nr:PAS domain-containing protein [Polymorphobacter sp.]